METELPCGHVALIAPKQLICSALPGFMSNLPKSICSKNVVVKLTQRERVVSLTNRRSGIILQASLIINKADTISI